MENLTLFPLYQTTCFFIPLVAPCTPLLTNIENIPLLMIPTAQPQIRNADDWEARFETVRSTFSSRVGQICNAALDRSIIAYNENSDAEERERCREETETLAILTGLEIDSAKSGIRPELPFLVQRTLPIIRHTAPGAERTAGVVDPIMRIT